MSASITEAVVVVSGQLAYMPGHLQKMVALSSQ